MGGGAPPSPLLVLIRSLTINPFNQRLMGLGDLIKTSKYIYIYSEWGRGKARRLGLLRWSVKILRIFLPLSPLIIFKEKRGGV
jgi:hypothetical protein